MGDEVIGVERLEACFLGGEHKAMEGDLGRTGTSGKGT